MLAVAFLTWFSVVGCLCGSGENDGPRKPAVPDMEIDDRFEKHAKANGWYLGGGSMVQLWDMFDVYYLPEAGTKPPVDILKTHHWGSFDLSKDNLIVAETEDRDPATRDTPHMMVLDLDLNTVWSDESKKHFDIYSDYRWSPDGKLIAWAHGTKIFVMDWATKEAKSIAIDHKAVVRDGPLYTTPSWAPDSKRLTYQTTEDEVAVINVETGDKDFLGPGKVPVWSPDGKTIACLKAEKFTTKAMLGYDPESRESRTLFETEWSLSSQPVWTPDSKYILFHRPRVNSIYGWLYFFDVAEGKFYSTGKQLAGLRDAQVFALPEKFLSKLALRKDNDKENPNRSPR